MAPDVSFSAHFPCIHPADPPVAFLRRSFLPLCATIRPAICGLHLFLRPRLLRHSDLWLVLLTAARGIVFMPTSLVAMGWGPREPPTSLPASRSPLVRRSYLRPPPSHRMIQMLRGTFISTISHHNAPPRTQIQTRAAGSLVYRSAEMRRRETWNGGPVRRDSARNSVLLTARTSFYCRSISRWVNFSTCDASCNLPRLFTRHPLYVTRRTLQCAVNL